jgi:ribA/ribD-fused uncharacterized protein
MSIIFNSKSKDYKWLSNFYDSPFTAKNRWGEFVKYKTVEHYYQSWKIDSKKQEKRIRVSATPALARSLGRKCNLHKEFDQNSFDIMKTGLIYKFINNLDLLEKLLGTDVHDLIHLSPWDKKWGVGNNGEGKNYLGILLMAIRDSYIYDKVFNEYKNIINETDITKLKSARNVLKDIKRKRTCKSCGSSCFNGNEWCDNNG